MPLITEEIADQLGASTVHIGVFLLMKTGATWVRAWSGVGPFEVAADSVDTAGGTYNGVGEVVGLPRLGQLINGVAERVEFTLAGVDEDTLRLADADSDDVRGAACYVGVTGLDAGLQPITAPFWVWEGEADVPRLANEPTASEDGKVENVRTVTVSVGTAFTGRRRPRFSYYTAADQRRRSPTDAFCDRVALYGGAEKKWP